MDKTTQINEFLTEIGFFEPESAAVVREEVLALLSHAFTTFVETKAKECQSENYVAKLYTFGSFRLGVHAINADIDVLCVGPRFVTRKVFFEEFYDKLEKLVDDENCSDIGCGDRKLSDDKKLSDNNKDNNNKDNNNNNNNKNIINKNIINNNNIINKNNKDNINNTTNNIMKILDCYVPLIKLTIKGINIDLVYASIHLTLLNSNVMRSTEILRGLDEKCVMSLNGNRVTEEILTLVPNTETFRTTLRFVKFWAKRRGIYGHSLGYFGGVAYAILVARVCQLFPNHDTFSTIQAFFALFSKWKWPVPVTLKKTEVCDLNFRVWEEEGRQKCPVITPCYPAMCCSFNVFGSTQFFMTEEFLRGVVILNSFNSGGERDGVSGEGDGVGGNGSSGNSGNGDCSSNIGNTSNATNNNVNTTNSTNSFTNNTTKSKQIQSLFYELTQPSNLLTRYKHFLLLECLKSDELFLQSKLRFLCSKMEDSENLSFAIPYNRILNCQFGSAFLVALDFSGIKMMLNCKKVGFGNLVKEFKEMVGVDIRVRAVKRGDLKDLVWG